MALGTDYLAQAPQQPKPQTPYAFTQAPPTSSTAPKPPTIAPKAPAGPSASVTGPGGISTQVPQASTLPNGGTDPFGGYQPPSGGYGPGGFNPGGGGPSQPPVITPPEPPTPPAGGAGGRPNEPNTPQLPQPPTTGDDKLDFDPFNSDRLKAAFDFYSGRLKEQANIATASADTNAASRGLYYSTIPEMAKTGVGGIQENLQNGLGQLSSSLLIPEAQMTMEAQNNYVQQALAAAALAGQGSPDMAAIIKALSPNPTGNSTDPYSNIGNWLAKL